MTAAGPRSFRSPRKLAALALFPLLAVALFPRAFLGQATLFHYDTWMQNLTFRAWWFEMLRDGHFATWCPGMFAGYPLFAETQTGPLYPPTFLLFSLLPPTLAFSWSVIGHFAFAGIGAFVAARRFGAGWVGALYAGVAFELSGFLVTHVVHFNLLLGAAWMPWVAAFALGAAGGSRRDALALSAAFAALCLGAHPYATLMNIALAGAVALGGAGRSPGATVRSLATPVAAALLGAVMAAVQLLPTRDFLPRTTRGVAVDWSFLTFGSFPPWNVFSLASPDLYGTPVDATYWGGRDWSHYAETCAYVGLLTIALAIVALALRRDRATLFLAIVAAVSALLMLGRFTPVYRALTWIPLFESTRLPGRFALPATFAVVTLAGLGLDALPRASRGARRAALIAAALAVLVLGAGAWREGSAARQPDPELTSTGRAWPVQMDRIQEAAGQSGRRLGIVALGTLVLLGALLGRSGSIRSLAGPLAVAWTAGELFTWGGAFHPVIDPGALTRPPPVVTVLNQAAPDVHPRPRVFRQGVDEEWIFRPGAPRTDLMTPGWKGRSSEYRSGAWTLPPNSQLLYGVDSGEGFTSLLPLAWLEWMGLDAQPGATPRPDLSEAQADLLALDAVVSTGGGIRGDGWAEPIQGPGDVWLSPHLNAMPRVRLARSWRTVGDRAELIRMLREDGHDPRESVLLEAAPPGLAESFQAGPVDEAVDARETGPGRWEIDVPPGGDALVIVSECHDPDWIAESDGTRIPVFRADGLFLAFARPPQGGRVELRHAPASLRIGSAVSIAGLLAFAGLAVWMGRRRARAEEAPFRSRWVGVSVPRIVAPAVALAAGLVVALSVLGNAGNVKYERRESSLSAAAARVWMAEAGGALAAGALDPAIALLRSATRRANHDATIHYRLGLALRRAGRVDEAAASFERALDIEPSMRAAEQQLRSMQQQAQESE